MTSNARTIAILLAAVLALSLLLTACGNGSDTPTEDNTTPGTSSTPGVMDTQTPTPDNTTEPDNTPGETDPTSATSETDTPVKKDFAWLDPSNYDMEKKKEVDDYIKYLNGDEIDIDKLIGEVFEEYGEFINENITLESVRIAICAARPAQVYSQNNNFCRLPEETCNDVNDFLISKGKEPLDVVFDKNNVEQSSKHSIAALAIAASICYESNRNGDDPLFDLGKAFDDAYRYDGRLGTVGACIMNGYYVVLPE